MSVFLLYDEESCKQAPGLVGRDGTSRAILSRTLAYEAPDIFILVGKRIYNKLVRLWKFRLIELLTYYFLLSIDKFFFNCFDDGNSNF
jgi:hypothetical protein